ncbi:Trafficking protein particle complex subunit 10 [Mactra antiquata]
METKPIVTSHGNQVVFSSLHKRLIEALPKEPTEWRRSYGRPARNVHVEASFVPYDDDILPDDSIKTLVSRLYFHIFWIDCDLEAYKQKEKEEISDWSAALKAKNIPDWLIVVFNSDENKSKSKLLPRSSVYDKIKSDFCSKNPDRIFVLEQGTDSKSQSLWNSFISRLRLLLLQAFTRHLQKYEDNMRALREKRNEVGWNFQEYFIVQEELAFMFEMLGLLDDAMIQYDELDALFTQFILNHASGQSVPWLKSLMEPCKTWAGLSLYKSISWEKRDLIKDNKASLLEFRNYLFSRQCAILLLQQRPGEIIHRAIEYLHATVQEMKTLEIEINDGGLDCWVYLSGLEVLLKCQELTDSVNPRSQSLNTAYLWDYVCRKLQRLGETCGLMPGDTNAPSSEQLSLVIDLTSGMGLTEQEDNDDNDGEELKVHPSDKLREALSSRESFQRIYLEQSELAMGTFKHIGRFRSARMIGKNLADFYMKLGEPQKAENYLSDAMTSYHQEGWKKLRDVTRLELANCQYQVNNKQKYSKTACQVASSNYLDMTDKQTHMSQVLAVAQSASSHVLLKASPLLKVEVTEISETTVAVDEKFYIKMTVENTGPCDIQCNSIWLTMVDCAPEMSFSSDKSWSKLKTPVTRQTSNSSLDNRIVMNLQNTNKQDDVMIDFRLHYEGNVVDPESVGIACTNSHEVLKRSDSSGGVLKKEEEPVTKDTLNQCITLNDVMLKPGKNFVTLKCEGISAGNYQLGQAGIEVGNIEFLTNMKSDLSIAVTCDNTFCEIIPDSLLAGRKQDITVCLHAGNIPIDEGCKVKITALDNIKIESTYDDDTVIIQDAVHRGGTTLMKINVFHEPSVQGETNIDSHIAFDCSWLPRALMTTVQFLNPFIVSHKLHTAGEMKYIQMMIQGQCKTQFVVSDWSLIADSKDLDLISLNKIESVMKVNADQSCSLLWQVKSNLAKLPKIEFVFKVNYGCVIDDDQSKQIIYKFSLDSFQTLFSIKSDVIPINDNKVCMTGTLSKFTIHVHQMPGREALNDQDLLYEVIGQSYWNVHGKSTGIFSVHGGNYTTSVEVMPLVAGFIPFPRVKLYKYTGPKKPDSSEVWIKNAVEDDDLFSTDDDSDDSGPITIPYTQPFDQGQVYYCSMGKQTQVLASDKTGEVEVSRV